MAFLNLSSLIVVPCGIEFALFHRHEIKNELSKKTRRPVEIPADAWLPYQLVFGPHRQRLAAYDNAPFFTLVNYEQMLTDALDVNARLRPDIIVLDEAQRIKNWSTKTAQAIKRLQSRYAFVLTGTPIENRIDELFSIVGFLDPAVFGPLFRFNREFYELDDRGRRGARWNTATWIESMSASGRSCCGGANPKWKRNCRTAPTTIILSRSANRSRRHMTITCSRFRSLRIPRSAVRSLNRSRKN